jgi:hypothetical protein
VSAAGRDGTSDKAEVCAKCVEAEPLAGHIVWTGPIRFKADGLSQFRRGTPVRAHACQACGRIELSLEST